MDGRFVIVLGSDGCGKTTLANELEAHLSSVGMIVERSHWRPSILPSPRRFIGQTPMGDPSHPHAKEPHNLLVSHILLGYYFLDVWLGFWLQVLPAKRSGKLIINERYFYDVVFDPLRHRLEGVRLLARWLGRLIPHADDALALYGDPAVIYLRKPELSVDEIKQQQDTMREYLSGDQRVAWIDTTDRSPEEVCEFVISRIFDGKEGETLSAP